jgi:Domain of unknown function (DUF4263)
LLELASSLAGGAFGTIPHIYGDKAAMPERKKKRAGRKNHKTPKVSTRFHGTPRSIADNTAIELQISPRTLGVSGAVGLYEAIDYLEKYIESYKKEYLELISNPPTGRGYPDLEISPYVCSMEWVCFLATDGYTIGISWEVDNPSAPYRVIPPKERIDASALSQKFDQAACISTKDLDLHESQKVGVFPNPKESACKTFPSGLRITVSRYDQNIEDITNLHFFANEDFHNMVSAYLSRSFSVENFWCPVIFFNLLFMSSRDCRGRYCHYLEVSRDIDRSAWDQRAIWIRVKSDVMRDYVSAVNFEENDVQGYSSGIRFSPPGVDTPNHLSILADSINKFEKLLIDSGDSIESVFRDFLLSNPILIDAYGKIISKPRWRYPEGEASPVGKEYVEPDFVIVYPGNRYRLIEIERPSKILGTNKGHPRSELSQSANQLGEWITYLDSHAHLIRDKFPKISRNCECVLIIGKSSKECFGEDRDPEAVRKMYENAYACEIWTYDDLLARARLMHERLSALSLFKCPR